VTVRDRAAEELRRCYTSLSPSYRCIISRAPPASLTSLQRLLFKRIETRCAHPDYHRTPDTPPMRRDRFLERLARQRVITVCTDGQAIAQARSGRAGRIFLKEAQLHNRRSETCVPRSPRPRSRRPHRSTAWSCVI